MNISGARLLYSRLGETHVIVKWFYFFVFAYTMFEYSSKKETSSEAAQRERVWYKIDGFVVSMLIHTIYKFLNLLLYN